MDTLLSHRNIARKSEAKKARRQGDLDRKLKRKIRTRKPYERKANGRRKNQESPGLYNEKWAQVQMTAFHRFEENLRHYHCLVCKEAWLLPDVEDRSETGSRVDYILLTTTWVLVASQQNYKAPVKWRNCWLRKVINTAVNVRTGIQWPRSQSAWGYTGFAEQPHGQREWSWLSGSNWFRWVLK